MSGKGYAKLLDDGTSLMWRCSGGSYYDDIFSSTVFSSPSSLDAPAIPRRYEEYFQYTGLFIRQIIARLASFLGIKRPSSYNPRQSSFIPLMACYASAAPSCWK